MEVTNEEQRRKRIRSFMLLNPTASKIEIVKHFEKEGFRRRTIYDIINRINEGTDDKKKPGGGRPAKPLTPRIADDLVQRFDGEAGASKTRAAIRHNVSRTVIDKWLDQLGIEKKVRKKIPMTTENQKKKQKQILRKISRQEFKASNDNIHVLMDDETYLDFNGYNCGKNKYYYESGLLPVDEEKKYITKTKFPNKIMVWIAISPKGFSKPYFRRQREGAVNGQVYREECIKKRLIPFIRQHYPEDNYIFWPDLASSHYAKPVIELLEEQRIKVLSKDRNPPNVPQLRPIETFWSHFKSRVFDNGFQPKTIEDLEKRAKKILTTFDQKYCENLMKEVGRKIRVAAERGPLSCIN